jgi:hypothetical protein
MKVLDPLESLGRFDLSDKLLKIAVRGPDSPTLPSGSNSALSCGAYSVLF